MMGLQVLVVEDDEMLARALARMLVRSGFGVTTCSSLREARLIPAAAIDVVIADLNLLDGSGLELASELALHQHMIILTGARPEDVGSVPPKIRVLMKPVDGTQLRTAIEELRRSPPPQPLAVALAR